MTEHLQAKPYERTDRRRALPILWRVDRATGVPSAPVQRRFAQRLAALVPEAARVVLTRVVLTRVVLTGDGEFHCVGLLRQARHQGWDFCVRLHADTYVRPFGKARWRECRALDPVEGQRRYVEAARVTKAHGFGPVGLVYHWAEGEDAPWRLVTRLSSSRKTVRFYRCASTANACGSKSSSATGKAAAFVWVLSSGSQPDLPARSALAAGAGIESDLCLDCRRCTLHC
jgi:hypothetical protein